MKRITIPVLFLIILCLLLTGCAGPQSIESKEIQTEELTGREREQDAERVLPREVADGKLVEVYDEYVRMKPGDIVKNWIIINNVKEQDQEFTIQPCGGCDFNDRIVPVPAGEHRIVQFKIRAMEGQKEIRVKDSLNNAYGYAQISVIVE